MLSETGYGQDIELYVVPIDIERTDNMSHTLSQLVMRWLWECLEFGENLKLNYFDQFFKTNDGKNWSGWVRGGAHVRPLNLSLMAWANAIQLCIQCPTFINITHL